MSESYVPKVGDVVFMNGEYVIMTARNVYISGETYVDYSWMNFEEFLGSSSPTIYLQMGSGAPDTQSLEDFSIIIDGENNFFVTNCAILGNQKIFTEDMFNAFIEATGYSSDQDVIQKRIDTVQYISMINFSAYQGAIASLEGQGISQWTINAMRHAVAQEEVAFRTRLAKFDLEWLAKNNRASQVPGYTTSWNNFIGKAETIAADAGAKMNASQATFTSMKQMGDEITRASTLAGRFLAGSNIVWVCTPGLGLSSTEKCIEDGTKTFISLLIFETVCAYMVTGAGMALVGPVGFAALMVALAFASTEFAEYAYDVGEYAVKRLSTDSDEVLTEYERLQRSFASSLLDLFQQTNDPGSICRADLTSLNFENQATKNLFFEALAEQLNTTFKINVPLDKLVGIEQLEIVHERPLSYDTFKNILLIAHPSDNQNPILCTDFGDDIIISSNVSSKLYGGAGDDILYGGTGNDELYGEDGVGEFTGNDKLYGGEGNDKLYGENGNDQLYGGAGIDHLYGDGHDEASGENEGLQKGQGDDWLFGGDDSDILYGGRGDDHLFGDGDGATSGRDETLQLNGKNDWLYGGSGDDNLYGGKGNDILYGDDENHHLTGDDKLYGGSDHDRLYGGQGNDLLYGDDEANSLTGNDFLYGGSGNDRLYGGKGNDYLYGDAFGDLGEMSEKGDLGTGRDNLYGGGGDDHLYGGGGNDILYGDDTDNTETGNDHLYGGSGRNRLYGGRGFDRYYLETGAFSSIYDHDRRGAVYLDGETPVQLTGGRAKSSGGNGIKTYYAWIGNDLYQYIHYASQPKTVGLLTIKLNGRTMAEVRDFKSGDLGIVLEPKRQIENKKKTNTSFTDLKRGEPWRVDPLALDLDGDGWLVYDRNGDGLITSGRELFGDNTLRYDGEGACAEAFEALTQEDTNSDGVVNELDDNWSQLKVWRDLNQDGISQEEELFTMEELGITGLNLDQQYMNQTVNGGRQTAEGTYTKEDGSTGLTGQFDLNSNPFYNEFPATDIPEELADLPDAYGSGAVRDLLAAIAIEESQWAEAGGPPEGVRTLKDILLQYCQAETRAGQKALLEDLALAWAMTSGYRTLEERSEGYCNVSYFTLSGADVADWNRQMMVLEAFNGEYLFTLPKDLAEGQSLHTNFRVTGRAADGTLNVTIMWGDSLSIRMKTAYNDLLDSIYNSLLLETRLAPVMALISSSETDGDEALAHQLDFSRLIQYFQDKVAADPLNGIIDLLEFNNNIAFPFSEGGLIWYQTLREIVSGVTITPELQADLRDAGFNVTSDGRIISGLSDGSKFYQAGQDGGAANGSNSSDGMFGGAGVDFIRAGAGDDLVEGGAGNDELYGDSGDDILEGGSGDDRIYGGAGDDSLDGGSGNDMLDGGVGNDLLHGGLGDDRLVGGGDNDMLYGDEGNDKLEGHGGEDMLFGGDGDDELYGNEGDDILDGGAGNDYLHGNGGNDTFVYGRGYGHDYVETLYNPPIYSWKWESNDDVIRFTDLNRDDIDFFCKPAEIGLDLVIKVKDTGETLTISRLGYDIASLEFADGSIVDMDEIWGSIDIITMIGETDEEDVLRASDHNTRLNGAGGDDRLIGGKGDDVLDGGTGYDLLEGGGGSDTYIFGRGYGHDVISAVGNQVGQRDTLFLKDLLPGEIELEPLRDSFTEHGDALDLRVRILETSETIIIKRAVNSQDSFDASKNMVIKFGDGSTCNLSDLLDPSWNCLNPEGTNSDDIIFGSLTENTINGHGGNDIIFGGAANDVISGGDGNDIIYGEDGDDVIDGGAGDDVIYAGNGNGTLIGGDGDDIIRAGTGDNVIIAGDGNDTIYCEDANNVIEAGDGDDVVYIHNYQYYTNIIDGGAGNDTFITYSFAGSRATFIFGRGSGHDTRYYSCNDVLRLTDLTLDDVVMSTTYARSYCDFTETSLGIYAYDVTITIKDTGETFTFKEAFHSYDKHSRSFSLEFADGTIMPMWQLISDFSFHFGSGQGDFFFNNFEYGNKIKTINFTGLERDDVHFWCKGDDLLITIKETGETLTIYKWVETGLYHGKDHPGYHAVSNFKFESGDLLTRGELNTDILAEVTGTDDDDTLWANPDFGSTLHGGAGNDTLYASKWEDVLDGGAGNDILIGAFGYGQDTFVFGRGYGHDRIEELNETDIVRLVDLSPEDVDLVWADADGLIVRIRDTQETLTIKPRNYSGMETPGYFEFTDGVTLTWDDLMNRKHLIVEGTTGNDHLFTRNDYNYHLIGIEGNDNLIGGVGDDILDGGSGNDVLSGGAGNDFYIFGVGYGHDVISDDDRNHDKHDTIKLIGLNYDDVSISASYVSDDVYDLVITIKSTGETLTVKNGVFRDASSFNPHGIEALLFDDGTTIGMGDIYDPAWFRDDSDDSMHLQAGDGGEILTGGSGADEIYGGAGNDQLFGKAGADIIDGGSGDDVIDGGDDGDIIIGGDGDDIIDGGNGDDLIFGGQVYQDIDEDGFPTYSPDGYGPDNDILRGGAGNDILIGGSGDDELYGGEGDDILLGGGGYVYHDYETRLLTVQDYGGGGRDLLDGGAGNDIIYIGGRDKQTIVFGRGYGHDVVMTSYMEMLNTHIQLKDLNWDDVTFNRGGQKRYRGYDVIITIKETGETLTLQNAFCFEYQSGYNWATPFQGIQFADRYYSWEEIVNRNPGFRNLYGTNENDYLSPYENGNLVIHGLGGNDNIWGRDGNDAIYGGDGNDVMDGGYGDDLLVGGAGDDIFVVGRGHDTVDAYDVNPDKRDIVRLEWYCDPASIHYSVSLNEDTGLYDLVLMNTENGDTVRILSAVSTDQSTFNPYGIQGIEFSGDNFVPWDQIFDPAWFNTLPDGGRYIVAKVSGGNVNGTDFNDVLHGLSGNDILNGGGGDDTLMGGEGSNTLDGGTGNDTLLLSSKSENTVIFARGYGHDVVEVADCWLNDTRVSLSGLSPEDVTFDFVDNGDGGYKDLVIAIKDTGETLSLRRAFSGNFADPQDLYSQYLTGIEFSSGYMSWNEICLYHNWCTDVIGTDGDDRLSTDYAHGGSVIYGLAGNDELYGRDGNDTLDGGSGDDILDGYGGNDLLIGGEGNDVFVFSSNYGHDIIDAFDSNVDKYDVVRLSYLNIGEVAFHVEPAQTSKISDSAMGSAYDLIITIKHTGETLTILDAIWSDGNSINYSAIQAFEFNYGMVMTVEDIISAGLLEIVTTENPGDGTGDPDDEIVNLILNGGSGDDTLIGGAGDDELYGHAGNDILDGTSGNDHLEGGFGDDIYVFGRGYGHDTINAEDDNIAKRDIIRLVGVNLEDVEFMTTKVDGTYHHVIIRIRETGETLTIRNAIITNNSNTFNKYSIQAVEFGDGTVMDFMDIGRLGIFFEDGTEGDDYLEAGYFNTTLRGGAGNDTLVGTWGNNTLDGGEGDDTIIGGRRNDILIGGVGNDYLEGGSSDDVYVYGMGYGHDEINAIDTNEGKRDIIRLVGLSLDDIEFMSTKADETCHHVIIRIRETGETLTIRNAIITNNSNIFNKYSIQAVEFGDGTVMDFMDIGRLGTFFEDGTEGDDYLEAGYFNTTLRGGAGNDTLVGTWGNNTLDGGEGDDTVIGGRRNDSLIGGAGNDYLEGGSGDDIYVFGRGYGHDEINAIDTNTNKRDIIRLVGLSLDDIEFMSTKADGTYHHVIFRIKETGETLTIRNAIISNNSNLFNKYSIQAVEFGDGMVVDFMDIGRLGTFFENGTDGDDSLETSYFSTTLRGGAGNDTLVGTWGNNILDGGEGNDTITGGRRNDFLIGGLDADTLCGGAGDDTYIFSSGDGRDTINNTGGGNDLLKFEDLNPADLWFGKSGNHLLIGLVGTSDQVMVNNWYASGDNKIDQIEAGGSYLVESQVAQMVQAMAGLGAPGGENGQWTDEQREALAPVLSSYWQPRV